MKSKSIKLLSIQLLLLFSLIELSSIILFRGRIRKLYPLYLNLAGPQSQKGHIERGYPRWHFTNHPQRGFDIKPMGAKIKTQKPLESSPYYVWGNSIGCFDKEIPKGQRYSIYLAGDSFTWGYAPFEKKFGTVLEKKIKSPVAKCGVTHTGTKHQFDKFLEITQKLGYFPSTVIVSIYENDISNDFFYPHTRVVQGYQVDNIAWRLDKDGELEVKRFSDKYLDQKYREWKRWPINIKDSRQILATSVMTSELFKLLGKPYTKSQASTRVIWEKHIGAPLFSNDDLKEGYPINSKAAVKNKSAIIDWIKHSKQNGYMLYFSPIPCKEKKIRQCFYQSLHDFITTQNGVSWDFESKIIKPNIRRRELYWNKDGHYNVRGNKIYAMFLYDQLKLMP